MSINRSNDKNIPTKTDAYYEDAYYETVAGQEEIYLEEREEELRDILVLDDDASAAEIVTGDSDNPSLSDEVVVEVVEIDVVEVAETRTSSRAPET